MIHDEQVIQDYWERNKESVAQRVQKHGVHRFNVIDRSQTATIVPVKEVMFYMKRATPHGFEIYGRYQSANRYVDTILI